MDSLVIVSALRTRIPLLQLCQAAGKYSTCRTIKRPKEDWCSIYWVKSIRYTNRVNCGQNVDTTLRNADALRSLYMHWRTKALEVGTCIARCFWRGNLHQQRTKATQTCWRTDRDARNSRSSAQPCWRTDDIVFFIVKRLWLSRRGRWYNYLYSLG